MRGKTQPFPIFPAFNYSWNAIINHKDFLHTNCQLLGAFKAGISSVEGAFPAGSFVSRRFGVSSRVGLIHGSVFLTGWFLTPIPTGKLITSKSWRWQREGEGQKHCGFGWEKRTVPNPGTKMGLIQRPLSCFLKGPQESWKGLWRRDVRTG